MKQLHMKKPHISKTDITQAAIAEQVTPDEFRERVAKRAYALYLERGCRQGCDVEDWVDAEREILGLQRVQA